MVDPGEVDAFPLDGPEARASFLLRLRGGGIRDLAVLRAMEAVPRAAFVPHRYADLAARDIALPIACGQTTGEPAFVARLLETLELASHHRVFEVGAGSGYATALLARLAHEVVAVERFHTLASEAAARLIHLGIANAAVHWADGLLGAPEGGRFDRIVIHAAVAAPAAVLLDLLNPDGLLVYPRSLPPDEERQTRQIVVRTRLKPDGTYEETDLFPSRLQQAKAGRSKVF